MSNFRISALIFSGLLFMLLQGCATSAFNSIKNYVGEEVVIKNSKTGDCLTTIDGEIYLQPYSGLNNQKYEIAITHDGSGKPLFVLTQHDKIVKSGEGGFTFLSDWEDDFSLAFQAFYKSKKDKSKLILARPVSINEFEEKFNTNAKEGFKLVWTQTGLRLQLASPMEIEGISNEATAQNWNILFSKDLPYNNLNNGETTDDFVTEPSQAPTLVADGLFGVNKTINTSRAPADACGAMGKKYSMEMTNGFVQTYDLEDSTKSRIATDLFWWQGIIDEDIELVSDPQVLYDKHEDRFFMTALVSIDTVNHDRGFTIAVSKTSDPNGDWAAAFIRLKEDLDFDSVRIDEPKLAISSDKMVVTGNLFANYEEVEEIELPKSIMVVFDKKKFMESPYDLEFDTFANKRSGVLCPVLNVDNDTSIYIVVKSQNSSLNGLGIAVFIVTGQHVSTISHINQFNISPVGEVFDTEISNNTFQAPQKDSERKMETNDSRFQSAVYRDGFIWCAQTVLSKDANDDQTCTAKWYKIKTNPLQRVASTLVSPAVGFSYAYPTIAVNKNLDVIIGMTAFGKTIYPSAAYCLYKESDPINIIRQPIIYKAGEKEYEFGKYVVQRWGDYSATGLDPNDDLSFWTIQQYSRKFDFGVRPVSKPGYANSWAKLKIEAVAPE